MKFHFLLIWFAPTSLVLGESEFPFPCVHSQQAVLKRVATLDELHQLTSQIRTN
jgi:hypothetical protein